MEEERTFAELGIPFPLFDAPAKYPAQYFGAGECVLCYTRGLCFRMGVGDDVLEACRHCGVVSVLSADSKAAEVPCDNCRKPIPINPEYHKALVCYLCLRAGRVAIMNVTEYGMVRYVDAIVGKTHGTPSTNPPDFAISRNEEDWIQVHVPKEWLVELTWTPTYSTTQGETWLFHCARPMVCLGDWGESDFIRHAPDGNGKALFERTVDGAESGLWDAMWAGQMRDSFAIFMFHCPVCGTYRGHWDMF